MLKNILIRLKFFIKFEKNNLKLDLFFGLFLNKFNK